MTTASKAKTLHEKLVEVALAVRNIEKGGRNEAQKYAFVQEADVVRAVWPPLLERGVLFYPTARTLAPIVEYANKSGGASFLTSVVSTWMATDGTDSIEIASMGQGTDTGGDKGVYKALTGDKKYAVLQLLGIATGDDPEVERKDERETPAVVATSGGLSDAQRGLLFTTATEAGLDPTSPEGMKQLGQYIFDWTSKRAVTALDNSDLDKILANLREIIAVAAATA